MIPYGRQDIDELDIKAVVDVLQSDYLTQGPAVPRFEESVMQVTHSDYALAVNYVCRVCELRSLLRL